MKKSEAIELNLSLRAGTSLLWKDTSGAFANTCTSMSLAGKDSTAFTGTSISGPLSSFALKTCTHEPAVVDKLGSLSFEWIKGTTNGTVRSSGLELTEPATILGSKVTVTCVTSNTDVGTLTGVKEGAATVDINAVINCGSFLPSAKWEGSWSATTSTGGGHALGVVE